MRHIVALIIFIYCTYIINHWRWLGIELKRLNRINATVCVLYVPELHAIIGWAAERLWS